MGKSRNVGNKARLGIKLPMLTCVSCGETKIATRFQKRAYSDFPATDPRRYDKQCKLCKKPVPANAGPDYVHKEPVKRVPKRKKKKRVLLTDEQKRINKYEGKKRVRVATRIKSMQYQAERGCEECGERDPRKLEYDHRTPADKDRAISVLITDGYSWSAPLLRAEIRKCRVLCANCHRKHTIKQQGYYAHDDIQRTLGELAGKWKFDL